MNSDIFSISKVLFYEKGYSKTKISDITSKLGLVPGNFYRHYTSKEEVLKEIISSEISHYNKLFKEIPNKESFHEKIELLFKINLKFIFEKPDLFCLLTEIKNSTFKIGSSTTNLAQSINTKTLDSLETILNGSDLDLFTKEVASKTLFSSLNIFLENLLKDSVGNYCPDKLMTKNFDEEFYRLFRLVKSICYGLGVSNKVFSKKDPITNVYKEEFFLELLAKSYNSLNCNEKNIDILYVNLKGVSDDSNNFFIQNLLQSVGTWLNTSFRGDDQAGMVGKYSFALLLSDHSPSVSSLIIDRCREFEIILRNKYHSLSSLSFDAKLLNIEEGNNIDFKSFFASQDHIKPYITEIKKHQNQ